jgi:PIN domain nuclease of toxin-antitoxin system
VNVLLDTVALYRATTAPDALPRASRTLLEDEAHTLFVSLVSAWELAIKSSIGKLALPCPIGDFFPRAARDLLAHPIGLELSAIAQVADLPHHHTDPFDRLIIAQALTHGHVVMTSDPHFEAYGVQVVW